MLKSNAAVTPTPIRLNMFRFMVRKDFAPRTRKGHPDQRMTGTPRISSVQSASRSPTHSRTGNPTIGPMVKTSSGAVRTAPTTKRRRKSTSSGLGPSSPAGMPFGSSAIPQIGQSPGPTCSISGCIGQV